MHNSSTKQRLSAIRRRLGIFTGWKPRWVRERRERLARLALARSREALVRVDDGPGTDRGADVGPRPEADAAYVLDVVASARAATTEIVTAPVTAAGAILASTAEAALVPSSATKNENVPPPHIQGGIAPAPPRPRSRRATRRLGLVVALVLIAIALITLRGRGPASATSASGASSAPAAPQEQSARAVTAAVRPPEPGAPVAPGASVVEVRRGDTLWHLAAVHLGDPMRWPELYAANDHEIRDPDLIFPGQQLHVPNGARS